DPRIRPWFVNAEPDGQIRLTQPYFFYFLQTSGVTLSRKSTDGQHVIGADFTLSKLSSEREALAFAPRTKLALLDAEGRLLAQHQLETEDKSGQGLQQSKVFSTLFAPLIEKIGTGETLFQTQHY
ncbi:cache domain-containing protein, partial [Vibrio parahaemolyticus]|nr:cache domain-containing protein [Vibrio parahaemolyticus]